ncbi:MAG: DUF4234 domain-containing protein [Thermoleophilaceae bacterium]|nr:DUF4234 domain-containing protein [Thermoleophilaceae bacterium]
MAYDLQIRDSEHQVRMRSPWAAALLPIVTLGIYHLVWWYRVNRELRDFGRARGYDLGQNPTNSVLALFPGGLVVVPALVSYWRGTKRMQGAARVAGQEPLNGWIALVLFLVISPVLWAYMQSELNKLWRAEAEPLPGQPAPPGIEPGMPPRLDAEREPAAPPQPDTGREGGARSESPPG